MLRDELGQQRVRPPRRLLLGDSWIVQPAVKRPVDVLGDAIDSTRLAHCFRPQRVGRATPLALTRPAAT